MSRSVLQASQQKLAEKLTILNDRVVGMVTRLYNIKKAGEGNGNRLQYSWLGNLTNKGALSMGSQKSRTALSD